MKLAPLLGLGLLVSVKGECSVDTFNTLSEQYGGDTSLITAAECNSVGCVVHPSLTCVRTCADISSFADLQYCQVDANGMAVNENVCEYVLLDGINPACAAVPDQGPEG